MIDANSPGAYYDAWAKFFSLPRRILAVNSRGGQNKGPRKHSDQVDRLIARYVQEGDADEEGEDAQVGDDYEGDARFVDENGRDMGPVDRDARRIAKAMQLTRNGSLRKAWALLMNKSIEPVSDETYLELCGMFQKGDLTNLPPLRRGDPLEADHHVGEMPEQ